MTRGRGRGRGRERGKKIPLMTIESSVGALVGGEVVETLAQPKPP